MPFRPLSSHYLPSYTIPPVTVSSCSAGHVPTSCSPSDPAIIHGFFCSHALSSSLTVISGEPKHDLLCSTQSSYAGSVSFDHINPSLSPPRRDRCLVFRAKEPERAVYLDLLDVGSRDVAGFPRAAAGPQPPVFVAPLQD